MNKLATSIFAASAIAVSGSFCAAFAQTGSGTPPDSPVLMVGDSMMRLLGVAMEKQCKKAGIQPAVSFSSLGSGLVRPNVFDWNAKIDELARAHSPKTVFVALGTNDRQTLEGGELGAIRYGAPEWEPEYARRIGAFMDRLIANGATRVVWLLLPDMKEAANQEHAQLVNRIVAAEAQAESRRDRVTLFDLGPVLSRKPGHFSQFVMSNTGAAVAVRDPDGVHLTSDGAKLCARAILKTFWNK